MIFECSICHRQVPSSDPDKQISHGFCTRCYILFPDYTTGIDWKTATADEITSIKNDIADELDRDSLLVGEPTVEWPEDGLVFVENLVNEVIAEREGKDGKRC